MPGMTPRSSASSATPPRAALVVPEGALLPGAPERWTVPPYLSSESLYTAMKPDHDPLAAITLSGRLLRGTYLRKDARAHLKAWLMGLPIDTLDGLGVALEAHATTVGAMLGEFLLSSKDARLLVGQATLLVDDDATGASVSGPQAVWREGRPLEGVDRALEARDDIESLLVVLGIVALENPDEERADRAHSLEQAALVEVTSLDQTANAVLPLLDGYPVADEPGPSDETREWWTDLERLSPTSWWVRLVRG